MTVTSPAREGHAPIVLLVEDAEDNREMYASYLSQFGFRVMQAANAVEALDTLTRQLPDVMVTDIALPGRDGVALCRDFRQHARLAHTPIIALTGLTLSDEEVERTLKAGSNLILFKPCLPDTLLMEIHQVLTRPARLRD